MPFPSTIDWPESTLGCPLRASYRTQIDPRFVALPVEDGPPRLRLVTNDDRQVLNLSFLFNSQQLAEYENFYHNTLNAGTKWFNLRVLTGLGMLPHLCHFLDERRIIPDPNNTNLFRVEFDVEAYAGGFTIPPPFVADDPVTGNSPATPPTNVFDARAVTDVRPTDIINALAPVGYV